MLFGVINNSFVNIFGNKYAIIIDAPQDEINTLSGKIGKLSGITSKVIYSNK